MTRKNSSVKNDWHIYIVRCADGSLYTSIARDLDARLSAHNEGSGAKYTRGRQPVTLAYAESAADRAAASRREAAIKKLPRSAKLQLIRDFPHVEYT